MAVADYITKEDLMQALQPIMEGLDGMEARLNEHMDGMEAQLNEHMDKLKKEILEAFQRGFTSNY